MGLPKLPNGSHGHWASVNRYRRTWHQLVSNAIGFKPKKPLEKVRVTCIRAASLKCDYDNLVMSFKPVIDGLVLAGIIKDDDMDTIVERRYSVQKTTRKDSHVTVCVEEI